MDNSELDIVAYTWGGSDTSFHCVACTADKYETEKDPSIIHRMTWFLGKDVRPIPVHRQTARLTVGKGRARTCRSCSEVLAENPA